MALSVGYVRWSIPAFDWLTWPQRLAGGVISFATEGELYDLRATDVTRDRALEVLLTNRADFAVMVDREAGYPFREALYRRRAQREAREVLALQAGFDKALAQPALRAALVRTHGTEDDATLKQKLLEDEFAKRTFLADWLRRSGGAVTAEALGGRLRDVVRGPQ
jgi:hypothetical protein